VKALEAFAHDAGKIVLILGGRGKKAPYEPLASLVKTKVRKLVLIGEDAETIAKELGDFASFEFASDMNDAVTRSSSQPRKATSYCSRRRARVSTCLTVSNTAARCLKVQSQGSEVGMARKLAPDKWLFAATIGLALFGVVMVYSASA
jgi:hypothetical protein